VARIGVNINKKQQLQREQMLSERKPIVKQCKEGEGCKDIDGNFCKCYINPSVHFRNNKTCIRAFHLQIDEGKPKQKKRVGQQKQKKKK